MATVESEQEPGATILPFTGPWQVRRLVTTRELRRIIKQAGLVFVRYRAGPHHVGHVVVSKAEVLRRLDRFPEQASHHLEPHLNGIVLGA
ncbi:hypothetical protein [Tautonia plasticadhaerens]|uniref:Uncharacterized protein n=1 Tax=Tautonia plasticadhaerens TaxID=2527974 RepID=A0A518H425_9BACT|nr:hypothetical protein [Tautonia plasticadhaerens]QDV35582.1 hypothetical protein ElP_34860 [Tautonia plasticadhaerens]